MSSADAPLERPLTHAAIIDRLGGYNRLAAELGCAPIVVWRWAHERRIPPRRWTWFVTYAASQGVPLSLGELVAGYYRPAGSPHQANQTGNPIGESEDSRAAA